MRFFSRPGSGDKKHWWQDPDKIREGQRLGIGVSLATAVMSALALYRGLEARMEVLALVSAVALASGFLVPALLYPFAWILQQALKFSARLAMYLMLVLTFYLVFAPVGIVLRILGKDPLMRRIDPKAESYWLKRKPRDPSRAEKQF